MLLFRSRPSSARALVTCLLLTGTCNSVAWAVAPTATEVAVSRPATVQVQEGDMASVLAYRLKPRGASIEQMMVAILRLNPEAFIQGNVNLLRDGAVLRLPQAEEVFLTPAEQARQFVLRHHLGLLSTLEGTVSSPPPPVVVGQAASQPDASEPAQTGSDREALLERLRTAKAHLAELQQNIEELERLTREEEQAQVPPPALAEPAPQTHSGLPLSWIWLGVAAIIASMIGVSASRRPENKPRPVQDVPPVDAAMQFQARLGGLDLNLDNPSTPPTHSDRTL